MKRRKLSISLIAILIMSLFAGCGAKEDSNISDTTPTIEATAEPTIEPTEAPEVTEEAKPTKEAEDSFSTEAVEAAGTVDGVKYTNSLIGFSVSAPETWLVYGSKETYDLLAKTTGYDIATLKQQLKIQGTCYICYGTDTQMNENSGTDNLMVQAMDMAMFSGLGIEDVIKSLSALTLNQYKAMGSTCEISDPTKTLINGQDVYQLTSSAKMSMTSGETTIEQEINQEYIIFEKNNVLVYMILSTQAGDNSSTLGTILDSLSFQ